MNSDQPQDRAEALFKKKQERLREGQQAMAEYQADRRAEGEKTARLRALRLARDAAESQPDAARTPALRKKTRTLPKAPPTLPKTAALSKKTKKRAPSTAA
jgi:hypothetical protein